MEMKHHVLIVAVIILLFSIQSFAQENFDHLDLPHGASGPEAIAFDCEGKGPYVGVSDGRILKWLGVEAGWVEFAITKVDRSRSCDGSKIENNNEAACGRPLGLRFHPHTCELYIADAYMGLLKVDRNGGVATQLVTIVDGVPLKFANGLEIDPVTGVVYFTDTSIRFQRWQWELVVLTLDKTGRLIRYDPREKSVTTLSRGLAFPNGLALSKDQSFLLIAETTTGQIHKFWLSGPKYHTREMVLQLGGRPDNINVNANGEFWIAQNPTLPPIFSRHSRDRGHPLKIDGNGRILNILYNTGFTSDVTEYNGKLYLGSVSNPYVGIR